MRLLLVSLFTWAVVVSAPAVAVEPWQYKLDFGYGTRTDNLNLAIDGLLTAPLAGETTKLTKQDVDIHELRLGYRFVGDHGWYVKGYYDQGWVYSGQAQHTSASNASPSDLWSRLDHGSARGSTRDSSFAIGHQWRWQEQVAITPLVGYSRHAQHLRLPNANQTICQEAGSQVCILNQGESVDDIGYWQSQFSGPWIGLDARLNSGNITFLVEWEQHLAHYNASLDWQGNQELSNINPITQSGDGSGERFGIGISYWLSDSYLNLHYNTMHMKIKNGQHSISNQAQNIVEGNWRSQVFSISYTSLF